MKTFLLMTACTFAAILSGCRCHEVPSRSDFARQALEESRIAIRPGGVNGQMFWNVKARAFMFAPAFDIQAVPGAVQYRFVLFDSTGKQLEFMDANPCAPLSPVWTDVAPGTAVLAVTALDQKGTPIRLASNKTFTRTPTFTGNYPEKKRSYRESARMALRYLFNTPYIQYWRKTGRPDPSYRLYCYPAKLISAVIKSMCTYAGLDAKDRDAALEIACKAADYLIAISEPAGTPLEYMPPTYAGSKLTAKKYAGQNMLVYPMFAGAAYLKIFAATGEKRYLEAAKNIGNTYLKRQLPNGSWHLKVMTKTGRKTVDNFCADPDIAVFLNHLARATGDRRYALAAERYRNYLTGQVKSFNLEGQFEDVQPLKPYQNLTEHWPASLVIAELAVHPHDPVTAAMARELLRFCEDQFIMWEPVPFGGPRWHYPAVLEQYQYYVPIDAGLAKMIRAYIAMYKDDPAHHQLDLAKALALADSLTRVQFDSGRIPTCLFDKFPPDTDWLNCLWLSADALLEAAQFEQ